jgi:glycosidase
MSYFAKSGIGGIWLSPIYASPNRIFGYYISDFKDIHPNYGTMKDLQDLITEAKNLGIKVLRSKFFFLNFSFLKKINK